MFNNTANGVIFKEKFKPVNGKYKFQVTEFYPQGMINFVKEVPEKYISWKKDNNHYVLEVPNEVFTELQDKATSLSCEIYIYPKFKETK